MLGTLNGALEAREVRLDPGAMMATVTGFNEIVDRLPVLTRIEIEYRLRIPDGTRDVVDWALELHQSKCPTAATLRGAVDVTWTAEIEEEASLA
ncbi:MAG: hypothetical protein V3W24_06965 [Gemmatimonadota bacterium]|jgi:uncharacterized OsmC-like protein